MLMMLKKCKAKFYIWGLVEMKFLKNLVLLICLVSSAGSRATWADSFDLGLGLGGVKSLETDGGEVGWDLIAGNEGAGTQDWHTGGQLHLIKGITGKSELSNHSSDMKMFFESAALYATARSRDKRFDWLQFKAGIVSANFKNNAMEGENVGVAVGAGIVVGPEEGLKWHLLDVHEYMVAGHRFLTVSVSLVILLR